MTIAPVPDRIAVRTVEIPDTPNLLGLLGAHGGFAWVQGTPNNQEGIVAWGEVARVDLTGPSASPEHSVGGRHGRRIAAAMSQLHSHRLLSLRNLAVQLWWYLRYPSDGAMEIPPSPQLELIQRSTHLSLALRM